MTRVMIIKTNVCGAIAYHAKCVECGWQSKRFDDVEAKAVHVAKSHRCG